MKKIILILLLSALGSKIFALGPTQKRVLKEGLTSMKTLIDKLIEKVDDPNKSQALTPGLTVCGLMQEFLFGAENNLFDLAKNLYSPSTEEGKKIRNRIDLGKALLGSFEIDIKKTLNCPADPVAAVEDF